MNLKFAILLMYLMTFPLQAGADGTSDGQAGGPDEITFAPSSRAAFDRSGVLVRHRTLAGGALFAEHNGTLGNVTVARLGADGNVETLCTSDEEAARAWMAGESRAGRSVSLELEEK